jgi:hypothetical protein
MIDLMKRWTRAVVICAALFASACSGGAKTSPPDDGGPLDAATDGPLVDLGLDGIADRDLGADIAAVDTSAAIDTAPPVLVAVTVTPQQVDVTAQAATIDVALEVTDDSDIKKLTATFSLQTNTSKTFTETFLPSDYNGATGAFEKQIAIPKGQEPGSYVLTHAYLEDVLGNWVTPHSNDPTAAGLDIRTVGFEVVNSP